MFIRHDLPFECFTKIDRHVVSNPKLNDGAVRLYAFLCGLRNGANFSDAYLAKSLGISPMMITRRKKILSDANLILCEKISPRVYVLYIGHSRRGADEVKKHWIEKEDATE